MKWKQLRERNWYSIAVAGCVIVAFYVLLTHLSVVGNAIGTFIGYFRAVIMGGILAYLINPLANWFYEKAFRKLRPGNKRWILSVALAFVSALLVQLLLIGMLVPQFIQSMAVFAENYDRYAETLHHLINSSPLRNMIDAERLHTLSSNALDTVATFVKDNSGRILSNAAGAGKNVLASALALILSVYFLAAKDTLKNGMKYLLYALLPQSRAQAVTVFLGRCDVILVRYLIESLLDSGIVGILNAVFMAICRMPYIGMISVVVAATNLIPNFGPLIGGAIGAFVLLLVNPFQALLFLIFTCVLQFFDGYILKPKLFGNSLGVSGLLILVAGIVGGNIFGVAGVLLSIPAAAILSFVYRDYMLPAVKAKISAK